MCNTKQKHSLWYRVLNQISTRENMKHSTRASSVLYKHIFSYETSECHTSDIVAVKLRHKMPSQTSSQLCIKKMSRRITKEKERHKNMSIGAVSELRAGHIQPWCQRARSNGRQTRKRDLPIQRTAATSLLARPSAAYCNPLMLTFSLREMGLTLPFAAAGESFDTQWSPDR